MGSHHIKAQYCYFGSIVVHEHETLIETLHQIQNLILKFSYKNKISGVFYYANQHFYHCIEGESQELEKLCCSLKKLNNLQSITHITTIYNCNENVYVGWSMRYVSKDSCIAAFFQERNLSQFQPLELNQVDREKLVDVIKAQYCFRKKTEYSKGYRVRSYHKY
ncbi:BLUF domain-containing protein [Acinetobacter sp. B10A]|nr:BLUF domain-containing protein [Acinetobacter baretiae]